MSSGAGCTPSSPFLANEPCLPRPVAQPPVGPGGIHEIKHDGFRILAHRRGRSVRLITRNGYDLADRFPLAAEAIEALPIRSCLIDGEAIVCDDSSTSSAATVPTLARFCVRSICSKSTEMTSGAEPIEDRKRRFSGLVRLQHDGIALNEAFRGEGAVTYKHARALGCGRHCLEAARVALSRRPIGALVEGQEPGVACREARGR
jgi:bifunctional non-homologous end joining protein LigD